MNGERNKVLTQLLIPFISRGSRKMLVTEKQILCTKFNRLKRSM